MAMIEEMGGTVKNLFTGKKGKFWLIALAIVVVLGVVMAIRGGGNASSKKDEEDQVEIGSYPTYNGYDWANIVNDQRNEYLHKIEDLDSTWQDRFDQMKEIDETKQQQLFDQLTQMNDKYGQLQDKLTDLGNRSPDIVYVDRPVIVEKPVPAPEPKPEPEEMKPRPRPTPEPEKKPSKQPSKREKESRDDTDREREREYEMKGPSGIVHNRDQGSAGNHGGIFG